MDVRVTSRPLYQSAPLALCDECLQAWDDYERVDDDLDAADPYESAGQGD
jgi:hypothetical protein